MERKRQLGFDKYSFQYVTLFVCNIKTKHLHVMFYLLNVYTVEEKWRNRKQVYHRQQFASLLCLSSWHLLMSLLSNRKSSMFCFILKLSLVKPCLPMWVISLEVSWPTDLPQRHGKEGLDNMRTYTMMISKCLLSDISLLFYSVVALPLKCLGLWDNAANLKAQDWWDDCFISVMKSIV